ncbi:Uncharacterised protein [Mycobacteroides abscessus subsp. bolletii]|uniref:hypothetical protein n=1 Tax=Mycobacteroides abscessus TaxID=36809 RepID=UPI0009A75A64|nr:hypothetical protein [Mycobacteroides abscessus]SKY97920.1 Uncharacterised protein [Mycobacteroides abscessus subsp. bolletii]
MGWSIGYDGSLGRDIGYGVPAYCDHPKCCKEIDRGMSYVCGDEPFGGEHGCGMHFCDAHLDYSYTPDGMDDLLNENGECYPRRCERCISSAPRFDVKPDHPTWINWKLMHPSWGQWRTENPTVVKEYIEALAAKGLTPTAVEDSEQSA